MIQDAIHQAFRRAIEKSWDTIYVGADIHGVMLIPTYENGGKMEFYPRAENIMKYLSSRKDIVLILWTCSKQDEIRDYLDFFKERGIEFEYVNENQGVGNDNYGDYTKKPYMNLLLDDKAGFDPKTDWEVVDRLFTIYNKIPGKRKTP